MLKRVSLLKTTPLAQKKRLPLDRLIATSNKQTSVDMVMKTDENELDRAAA